MAFIDGSRIAGGRAYRQHTGFKNYIRERDNYTCQICGGPGHDVDHIIPYSISGETKPDGVRVLCHSCNCQLRPNPKYPKFSTLDDWYRYIEAELTSCNALI